MNTVDDRNAVRSLHGDVLDKLRAMVVISRGGDSYEATEFEARVAAREVHALKAIATELLDRLDAVVVYVADLPTQKDSFAAVITEHVLSLAEGRAAA